MRTFEHPSVFIERMQERFGSDSAMVVCWASHGYQFGRMKEVLQDLPLFDGCSILDVGAGRLQLLDFLEDNVLVAGYLGVDLAGELLDEGKKEHPRALTMAGDFLELSIPSSYDFVVSSGALVYANLAGPGHQWEWTVAMIKKMYEYARRACSFSTYSSANADACGIDCESWYVPDTADLLRLCPTLTSRFVVRHDHRSGLPVFTLFKS